jgi:hypothetical protein
MYINSQLSTCVGTQSPKYIEMAQGHISLSVITVGPTYRHAYECDVECVEYTEALTESEDLIADLESLSKEAPDAKRHAGNFEPAETVKSVPLVPSNDASKQIRIGSELDPK